MLDTVHCLRYIWYRQHFGSWLYCLPLIGCHYTNTFLIISCFKISGDGWDQTWDLPNTMASMQTTNHKSSQVQSQSSPVILKQRIIKILLVLCISNVPQTMSSTHWNTESTTVTNWSWSQLFICDKYFHWGSYWISRALQGETLNLWGKSLQKADVTIASNNMIKQWWPIEGNYSTGSLDFPHSQIFDLNKHET